MIADLKTNRALNADDASQGFLRHYDHEWSLEVDRQNPDVLRQFRDIKEISMSFTVFDFGGGVAMSPAIPRTAHVVTRRLSNHVHWVISSDDELACHHSRDVRMLACYLSLGGCLNARYRDWMVSVLDEKIARSDNPESIFMSNIRQRSQVIRNLAVAEVELPVWPSPKQVADRIRSFRQHAIFKDVNDVLAAVHESRDR
jgi:hypothetical protein